MKDDRKRSVKKRSSNKKKRSVKKSIKLNNVLKEGQYVLIDPIHLSGVENMFSNIKIPSNGKCFLVDGFTMFMFDTRYGAGIYNLFKSNNIVSTVDSDYGRLLLTPLAYLRKLDYDYLNWLVGQDIRNLFETGQSVYTGFLQLEEDVIVTYKNYVLKVQDYILDTKKIIFNDVEIEKKIKSKLKKGKKIERKMSFYLAMFLEYSDIVNNTRQQ